MDDLHWQGCIRRPQDRPTKLCISNVGRGFSPTWRCKRPLKQCICRPKWTTYTNRLAFVGLKTDLQIKLTFQLNLIRLTINLNNITRNNLLTLLRLKLTIYLHKTIGNSFLRLSTA